jgi:hypothetical protein
MLPSASASATTDKAKQDLFARLAEHHRVLAAEVEKAIACQQAPDRVMDQSMLSRHLATADRHIAEDSDISPNKKQRLIS